MDRIGREFRVEVFCRFRFEGWCWGHSAGRIGVGFQGVECRVYKFRHIHIHHIKKQCRPSP